MRYFLGGIVVWTCLAGPGLAQEATPDPVAGKALAGQFCRSCHLTAPEDEGPVADGVPPFMALAAVPGQNEDSLTAALLKQHPLMPQPPLSSRQAADVVAYILSLRN